LAGNTFGKAFKISTFGESHGKGLGVIIDGCPAGLPIDEAFIQSELARRRPGQSKIVTQRKEPDVAQILSGIFEGKATGTPIGMIIMNKDQKSKDYSHIADKFRPSHADFTYQEKYGLRDYRGGGRSSARETSARVAAGAVAKLFLQSQGITINGYVLGEPAFDKLHADLAKAMLSINACKGFEYGSGFDGIAMRGSEHNDRFYNENGIIKTKTNYSGGIQGGISNGMDIYFRVAFKPVATIVESQESVNMKGESAEVIGKGRHDPCVLPRAVPIVEAMTALVMADHLLRQRMVKA